MNQNQQLDKVRLFNWSLILKTEQENLSQLLLLLLIVVVWLLEFDIPPRPEAQNAEERDFRTEIFELQDGRRVCGKVFSLFFFISLG
jgi:hypothetical protein